MRRTGTAVRAVPVVHLAETQAATWAAKTPGTIWHPLSSLCSLAVVGPSTCAQVILQTSST